MRRRDIIELKEMRKMYTGIDIGGTKCAVVRGDAEGGIEKKIRFETTDVSGTLENIFSAIDEIGVGEKIGISCGGPLDSERGIILSPPNLPGWDKIHIVEMLNERYGKAAALRNDANACALAEWRFGAGRGTKNMVFLTFGTGMGAGLILDGRLYGGTNDMAGEIGHVRLADFGPVGYGKAGSVEGFCSGGGIAALGRMLAEERLQAGETVSFCGSRGELPHITAKKIADCAHEGAEDALRVYDICAEKLGIEISILIDILNPEKIVIGSIFERSGDLLRRKMQEIIERETLPHSRAVCEIVPAELGDSIGDYAAIAAAMEA